jgi:hypothetical protein
MTRSPETCAAQAVADLAEAATKGQSTVKRYIKTLVHDAGWTNRSAPNVKLIRAALTDAGVYMDEDITDLRLSRNAWVHLGTKPFPEKRTGPEFAREMDMNSYLQDWSHEAFAGIAELEGLRFVKSERRIEYDGKTLKIDLLFEVDDSTTVVVDLKAEEPPDGTIEKLRRYLNACRDTGLQPLRGVLITGISASNQAQADILAELAELRADYEVDWYQYRLGITLERVD